MNESDFQNFKLRFITPQKSEKETVKPEVSEEVIKRHLELSEVAAKKLEQKSLEDRLNELNKSETELSDLVREGLLGHFENDIKISDIIPIRVNQASDVISSDPLWQFLTELVPMPKRHVIYRIFKTVERYSLKFEDESQRVYLSRSFNTENLRTLGDLRKVPEIAWQKSSGFHKSTANFLVESIRQVE